MVVAVQSLQQPGDRRLARAAAPDDPEHAALGDLERDAVERRRHRARIAEGHVAELDPADDRGADAVPRAAGLGRPVDDRGAFRNRPAGLVDLHDRLRRLQHRLGDPLRHQHEREDRADIDRVLGGERQIHRDRDDAGCISHFQRVHQGLDPVRRKSLVEPELGHLREPHVELMPLPRVERQRLDRAHAVHRLDQDRAPVHLGLHRRPDLAPDRRQADDQDQAHQQAKGQHDRGHDRADQEHDRQKNDQHERVEHGAEQLVRQERTHLIDLVHVVHDLAGRRALEEVDRKVEQPIEHMAPDLDVGPGRQEQHQIAAQMAEGGLEHHQHHKGDAQHREGVEAAVIHDPVDHDPPEHDRRERQNAEQNARRSRDRGSSAGRAAAGRRSSPCRTAGPRRAGGNRA